MHVADAFIALISERPYREAFDFDSAIGIMIEDVKEFDMQVFLAFMDVIHEDGVFDRIKQSQSSISDKPPPTHSHLLCLTGLSRASPQ